MLHRTFWTERRLIGSSLIVGSLLFLAGAGMPVQDNSGNYVYNLSTQEALLVIYHHSLLWSWASVLFMSGTVVTMLGLSWLSMMLWKSNSRLLAQAAFLLILLATLLFLVSRTFDLGVDFSAAQELVKTGTIPGDYLRLSNWSDALFNSYTVLIIVGMLAYGGCLLFTRLLPAWLGWLMIGYNLLMLGAFLALDDLPPFLHQLLPIVIAVLLLLPRYQAGITSDSSATILVASNA